MTKVVTKNGLELDADAVVIGAGVHPDIMLARSAGLDLGDSGGIRTDSQLRASAPGVFAAGDVAEYSSVVHDGAQIRVEHWDVAFGHGKTVALNMLGKGIDHDVVPYFFSDISDWAGIEYVGPAREWDQEIVRGSFDDGAFTVFYLQSGRVRGALTVGRSDDLQAARRLIADGTDLGDRAARARRSLQRPRNDLLALCPPDARCPRGERGIEHCGTRTRTLIPGSRGRCLAIRRSRKGKATG